MSYKEGHIHEAHQTQSLYLRNETFKYLEIPLIKSRICYK